MTRAEQAVIEKYYPHGTFDGELGDSLRAACIVGYAQAELDLVLTAEDVKAIFNKVRDEQFQHCVTEGCYQKVADWFNKKRKEK